MIDKIIEQQETIKGIQENEDSAIKVMKMYEDYKLRVDKAIYFIELDMVGTALQILKGDDK